MARKWQSPGQLTSGLLVITIAFQYTETAPSTLLCEDYETYKSHLWIILGKICISYAIIKSFLKPVLGFIHYVGGIYHP